MENNKEVLAVPANNEVDITNLESLDLSNPEEELKLGLEIVGETLSMKDVSPKIKVSNHPIEQDGKVLGLSPIKKKTNNKALSLLNVSSSRKLTLPHSGYNLGIAKPKVGSMTPLQISLGIRQSEIGLNTAGIAHNNESAMFSEGIVEFMESLVELSTYKSKQPINDALLTDLPFIALLALDSLDENIHILQVCSDCGQRHEFTADWKNMIHYGDKVDTTFLTRSKVSFKDLEEYRSYINTKSLVYSIEGKDIKLNLTIPTIGKYIEWGRYNITKVTDLVDGLIKEPNPNVRRSMVSTTFEEARALQYIHFIDDIEIGEEVLKDYEDIYTVLTLLREEDVKDYVTEVKEYVKDNTIAVVGVPTYRCVNPKCASIQQDDDAIFDEVVTFNPLMSFFMLTNLKITRLVS